MKTTLQHIHMITTDKFKLASWYKEYLGFEILGDIEQLGENNGPLFISADGGITALSLFNDTGSYKNTKTSCIPAFGVTPEDFIILYKKMKLELDELAVFDHYLFYSYYFSDPNGTKIEINCTEVDLVKKLLKENNIETQFMEM